MKSKSWMTVIICLMAMVSLHGFCSSALASPYMDGLDAWERGDYAEAAALFRPLAERGFVEAQYLLAVMHEEGLGTDRNQAEAAKWYLIAASHGHADARYRLGIMCAEGRGIPQNHADAAQWLRTAAGQGHPDAQQCFGGLYASGQPTLKDCHESVKKFCRTVDYGKTRAQDRAAVSRQGATLAASSCETACDSPAIPSFQQMDLASAGQNHYQSGSLPPNN